VILRRSRISGQLTKEAGFVGKASGKLLSGLGGAGMFAVRHPVLMLAGVGGLGGGYWAMKDKGLYGLTPQHMKARIYGKEPPVVQPRSMRPVNPVRAHQQLAKQIGDWSTQTRYPWG